MARNPNVRFGLTVDLTAGEANAITSQAAGETATEKLSVVAAGLLKDLAGGGTMLSPPMAERINAAIGTIEESAIVANVEKAAGTDGDAVIVRWRIDPTQVEFYRQVAESNGISLEAHVKNVFDYGFMQGWCGSSAPDAFKLLVTADQFAYLQQRFEKDSVTGEDVVEALRAHDANFDPEPEEADPIMASLRGEK